MQKSVVSQYMANPSMFPLPKRVQYVPQKVTRNSADADKLHDAFRSQSRSPNMVPFDMLGMVSY